MKTINLTLACALALGLLVARAAVAGNEPAVDFRASAGYQYDSNVGVAEIDTNTGEADNAAVLEVGIDGRVPLSDGLAMTLGYGYLQTTWESFGEFDTALHRLQGELAWRTRHVDAGLALRHFAARLDGDRFFDLRQVSPSVGRLFGDSLYLRGAYTRGDKAFVGRDERDAVNDAVAADAYLLLDGMRHYLSAGLRFENEDAAGDAFDYDGRRLRFGYGRRLDAFEVKARVQFDELDYLGTGEDAEAARRDRRLRGGLSLRVPAGEHFAIEGEALRSINSSNVADYDFDEFVVTLTLAAAF